MCFEWLVITSSLPAALDLLQFAYRLHRSTPWIWDHWLPALYGHHPSGLWEGRLCSNAVCGLLISIVPSRLATKLSDLRLNPSLCEWVLSFFPGSSHLFCVGIGTSPPPHPEHRSASSMCVKLPALLTPLSQLLGHIWRQHQCQVCWRHGCGVHEWDLTPEGLVPAQQPSAQHQQN